MAFGQFTLVIDGHQQDGTTETKAKLYLKAVGSGIILSDTEFRFPTKYAKSGGLGISLGPDPFELTLDTDKAAGEGASTTIVYEGWVTSANAPGRRVFEFAAPEAGTVLNLRDAADDDVPLPISAMQVFRDEAEAARDEAQAAAASLLQVKTWARNPDLLVAGTITRDSNGAATSAPVIWPDGSPGTYTATTVSTAFPGAVDAYTITYGSPVTKTYTQPLITRDATTGAATNVPAITVA